MNIKITYNWLLEYLDTDADPYELQKYLSLCGPGVERVDKVDDDYVLDIEVTSNRDDMASVLGIAQEAQAILPMFGKKAKLKQNPLTDYSFESFEEGDSLPLTMKITDPSLGSRFSAIALSNVTIGKSPDFMARRLEMCGIRSLNNVVDISNYIMLSLGQPTHVFDYDGIGKATLILRTSKKGEKIKTLDEKEFMLPGGDIVIEDGNGEIIDLCGIMGGYNSSVKQSTKNIVLFIQTYEKKKIRRTSMITGQRTVAATHFEKGLDPERVEPAVGYGVTLLEKYADAKTASKVYDVYDNKYKTRIILVPHNDIVRILGVEIESTTIVSILNNLGFETQKKQNNTYQVMVPSWRSDDIEIKEDIVEEVARVYGYHNLPNNIQSTAYVKQPKEIAQLFIIMPKVKYFLKHIGLHEVMNYSMVSEKLLTSVRLDPKKHLELANTISEEIRYFRQSILPSLVKNIADNEGRKDALRFFEIAKVYLPREGELPDEQYKLGIATNTNFSDLKGIVEAVLRELKMNGVVFKKSSDKLLSTHLQAAMLHMGKSVGVMGQLKKEYAENNGIRGDIYLAELEFTALIEGYQLVTTYTPTNTYATVKLDLTIQQKPDTSFAQLSAKAHEASQLLEKVEVVDVYGDKLTLRFLFFLTREKYN